MIDINSFVIALQSNDQDEVNRWSESASTIIADYLRLKFRASTDDAQDCVQETLAMVFEKVQAGSFDTNNPGAYILATARNNYFKIYNENKKKVTDEVLDMEMEFHPDPTSILMDKEMMAILHKCIQQLADLPKKLINYLLKNPDAKSEKVAKEFNTSVNNIWTRKHRINQQLHACIEKNS
ncbi:MAG: hypothetical protein LAT84_05365 [Balneolia bacterium]|nr:hypothetical protein [Balneolia bacterium]